MSNEISQEHMKASQAAQAARLVLSAKLQMHEAFAQCEDDESAERMREELHVVIDDLCDKVSASWVICWRDMRKRCAA